MSIFEMIKEQLNEGVKTEQLDIGEELETEEGSGGSVEGDSQALVDAMIANAPGQKDQIGVILKYAANSNLTYDIWDQALDYYDSLDGSEEISTDEEIPVDDEEPIEDEGGEDELPADDEVPSEDEEEFPDVDEEPEEEGKDDDFKAM